MSVEYRYPHALAADLYIVRRYDLAVLYRPKDAQRLHLTFFLLAGDEGYHVSFHLGPVLEGLSGTAYSLIGGRYHLIGFKVPPRVKHGSIGLNGTVRLHCDEKLLRNALSTG